MGMERRREALLLPLAVIALAVGSALWIGRGEDARLGALVTRERAAFQLLRTLAAAEAGYKAREGRFGSVADLGRAGLLPPGATRRDGEAVWLAADGYRIDVLLPTGPGVGGLVPLGLPGPSRPDPDLAVRHFSAVARPLEPGVSGYRIIYLDEQGRSFVSEGLSDEEGLRENPLPAFRVEKHGDAKGLGIVWRPVDANLRSY